MSAVKKKKAGGRGLGRGLDALLGDSPTERKAAKKAPETKSADNSDPETGGSPQAPRSRTTLPIEVLRPNATQPRKVFNDDAIAELAASIKARGLLQPILVRPLGGDAKGQATYEIVAGERRWRASQLAQLHDVPVLIRELNDQETAEIALIENVQRVDLNPIEEAEAYLLLSETYGRTQADIAKAVGKSRSHVTNIMRLLQLPVVVRDATVTGALSMGHARALLAAPEPHILYETVIADQLSVRETEALVRRDIDSRDGAPLKKKPFLEDPKKPASGGKKDADTRALEADLAAALGLEVEVDHSKKGAGAVTIKYLNLDQLDEVCRRLMGTGV